MMNDGLRLTLTGELCPPRKNRRAAGCAFILCTALLTTLLFLLPPARSGLAALLNRLMDASEAVNAYAYRRYPVMTAPNERLAGFLLAAAALCLGCAAAIRSRRIFGTAAAVICAGVQIYFGLSLPAAVNIAVFTLCGILMPERISFRKALCLAAAAVVLSGIAAAVWPGVDQATETASEHVRDLLEHAAPSAADRQADAEPDLIRETRHTDTRALTEGDREAGTEREYRLVTIEEEEISRPKWIDYLKIAMLLLAAAAAVILPFVPAAALNRRRRKARETRAAFTSPDRNEAVCAMFRLAAKYLEKTGRGGGNMPFRDWPAAIAGKMPEKYVDSFQKCCILFEEAAYSDHQMTEEQTGQVREMLAETERLLYDEAGWRQRLRLRYTECLHE